MKTKIILNKDIIKEIILEIDNNHTLFDDPTLEKGKMGLSIFYFFCYHFYNEERYKKKGEAMVEESFKLLSDISLGNNYDTKYRTDSLSNVISSFGKALLFIQYKFDFDYDFTTYYNQISDVLIELNIQNIKEKDFDFFSGALSAGHFFINKYYYDNDNLAKDELLKICKSLNESAIYHSKDQVFWKAPALNDVTYLGISHGSAMIINFITKLFELNILNNESKVEKKLLKNAVNFLIGQKRNVIDGYFPHVLPNKEKAQATQFGICYGDLGVLYSLYNANKILLDSKIEKEVTQMLLTTTKRKKNMKYTFDAGIFYGASGIYCTFKDLFKRTNNSLYMEASEYWYNQIVTYRDLNYKKHAGFKYTLKSNDNDDNIDESDMFSFGWGLAGIGICLMQGENKKLPSISETLLIGI